MNAIDRAIEATAAAVSVIDFRGLEHHRELTPAEREILRGLRTALYELRLARESAKAVYVSTEKLYPEVDTSPFEGGVPALLIPTGESDG